MRRGILLCAGILMAGLAVAEQRLPARLEWADLHRLSVLASAPVTRIPVRPGQQVEAGALLLETEDGPLRADLAAARAALAEERIRLAEAEREYARNRELYDRTVLSQHDLRLAEAEWKAAQRRFRMVEARLRHVEQALAQSRIRAPVSGRVVAVHARPGELIHSLLEARPLVELAAADAMEAVVDWEGSGAWPGKVQVRVLDRTWPATCRPAGAGARGVRLRCRFRVAPETAGRLWAGMPAEVWLP